MRITWKNGQKSVGEIWGKYHKPFALQNLRIGLVVGVILISVFAALAGTAECQESAAESNINPILRYSSGFSIGQFRAAAVDSEGNLYLAGGAGADFPATPGAYDTNSHGGGDVAVAKVDADGNLIWATYLGGPKEDYAYVCAVNDRGELYVSGRAGEGFPTTPGAFDETFNGGVDNPVHDPADAFITKLSSDGSRLIYSTYLGGSGQDIGRAIHLHPTGEVVIAAGTESSDFPTTPDALLPENPGGRNHGYIAKLSADGSRLVFSTYFGTTNSTNEFIFSVAEDNRGSYWFAGSTKGTDWGSLSITPDAFQPERSSGQVEMFVGKLSLDGKKLVYLTWFGGSGAEWIETEGFNDVSGNFYITGVITPHDFPTTPGAYQSKLKGSDNGGFVARISVDGSLDACTVFDAAFWGPAMDSRGNIYCSGSTTVDGLATPNAFQTIHKGEGDAFLAIFDPTLSTLLYGSYLGGAKHEKGRFVAVSPDGSAAYIVGHTSSTDFPLVNAPWNPELGNWRSFAAKFDLSNMGE